MHQHISLPAEIVEHYFISSHSVTKTLLARGDGTPCHAAHWRRVCVRICDGFPKLANIVAGMQLGGLDIIPLFGRKTEDIITGVVYE